MGVKARALPRGSRRFAAGSSALQLWRPRNQLPPPALQLFFHVGKEPLGFCTEAVHMESLELIGEIILCVIFLHVGAQGCDTWVAAELALELRLWLFFFALRTWRALPAAGAQRGDVVPAGRRRRWCAGALRGPGAARGERGRDAKGLRGLLCGMPGGAGQEATTGGMRVNKKKIPKAQGTFDGEENAVLYQNYKEKALDIDSDEEPEPQEQKLDEKVVIHYKPLRSTWSQLSVVKKNGLSEAISLEERKRQEAIFEVISSEHSYLLSLEILIRMFKNSKELSLTMTKTESHHLFSNIADVYEASKKFFKELEAKHQNNIFIDDISDIVGKHAASTFDPYVKYCTNEVYQQRTLQKLLATNPAFKEVLSRIESHEDCRNLPMISFLILPMQRVTRLPLLMDTICQKTPKDSPKYESCKQALKEVSKRRQVLGAHSAQAGWPVRPHALRSGALTGALGIAAASFLRIVSDESYTVTDYSLREQLAVAPDEGDEPGASPAKAPASRHGPFRLALSSHAGERAHMLLGADTPSERARWIAVLGKGRELHETDRTTLTQVEIVRTYTAKQADELSLQVADVVLVYQQVNDGWYEGQRLRDGERGWFPMECAKEITCRATLDKNMERMGRLLGLETNV
ncbi:PREDICTED: rho guanine nucleotide exchange factor 26 [Tinamus guttatus]|uniref:rho guanine nucleotide exchange factor 26 n=1 Tax=Tinamus guttatus TaxID=94827 RepID=UPI00052E6B12|nr:PREDICTED: rho guanine nucleotide exchange factor 26 [Tinamus guttatus]